MTRKQSIEEISGGSEQKPPATAMRQVLMRQVLTWRMFPVADAYCRQSQRHRMTVEGGLQNLCGSLRVDGSRLEPHFQKMGTHICEHICTYITQ